MSLKEGVLDMKNNVIATRTAFGEALTEIASLKTRVETLEDV